MTAIDIFPYHAISGRQYEEPVTITVKRSHFAQTTFHDGKTTFSFTDCDFKQLIIENDEAIEFENISIAFAYCYIENIQVEKITTKNLTLHFGSSIVSGRIRQSPLTDVSFNNCFVTNNMFLLNLPKVSVTLTEENIFPRRWLKLLGRLSIADVSEILDQKQSYHVHDCLRTTFSSSAKEDSPEGFYLRFNPNPELRLGYRLTTSQKALLNINLSLRFELATQDSATQIINMTLRSLSLFGIPKGKISLEQVKISEWFISEFQPKGEATFYGIAPQSRWKQDSKISFHQSNLDQVSFDAIDFTQYALVSFYRTKFSKTVFTSCKFPRDAISFEKFTSLPNVHYLDNKAESFYKDRYEMYLQLKIALEATSNFHEAQKLFGIANDSLRKIEEISRWDKFILWINRHSNNHGLSISRPLMWFLLFTIGFYLLYLLSLGRIFNRHEIDYDLIGYYFSFIDLTHRNDFLVAQPEFNAFSLAIDYVNKILVSFFIFQFVAAFRKYGRK